MVNFLKGVEFIEFNAFLINFIKYIYSLGLKLIYSGVTYTLFLIIIPICIEAQQLTNYSEFANYDTFFYQLKESIKDSKVVLLGEINHGSGSTFEVKTELVKFLHENMDFDVIIFESNLYDCNKGWEYIQRCHLNNLNTDSIGVFKIWSGSQEMQPLFKYLSKQSKTDNPLILSGMDIQFPINNFRETMLNDISELLDSTDIELENKIKFSSLIENIFTTNIFNRYQLDTNDYKTLINGFNHLFNQQKKTNLASNRSLLYRVLENLKYFIDYYYNFSYKKYINDYNYESFRDSLMGLNVIWLYENFFNDKKIIIWGANYHILRNFHYITDNKISNKLSAGDIIYNYFKSKSYSIGITVGSGETADWWNEKEEKLSVRKKSIEMYFQKINTKYCFVDFSKEINPEFNSLKYSNILGGMKYKSIWTSMMNGIIYISNSKRSHSIKAE